MNLVKISEMLKNAPDQALAQELQNPSGSAPSYMILSELERRKKLRGSVMNEEPQTSVAEDLEMESSRANQIGIGALDPYAQAQAPQPQMQGYAGGGEVRGYAAGDYVDYSGGYPIDAEENTFWPSWEELKKRTGYGRMLPPAAAKPAPQPKTIGTAAYATDPNYIEALTGKAPGVAPTGKKDTGAGIPAAAAAKGVQPPAATNPLMDELKGYRKELADLYKNQADLYKQQSEDIKKSKDSDIGMALMQAGLGIAGGRSQYALENISQGALPAVQQYGAMDRERRKELQKLALGQGALGIERVGAQMKGAATEGELGIKERAVGADERRARAAEISAGASAAYHSGALQQMKLDNTRIGQMQKLLPVYEKTLARLDATPEEKQVASQMIASITKELSEYYKLGGSGTISPLPKGVTVREVKP